MAPWPSGKAKVCNTSTPSSNLGVASKNKCDLFEVAFIFIQADEEGLGCNQRAERVVCNCDEVAHGITRKRVLPSSA